MDRSWFRDNLELLVLLAALLAGAALAQQVPYGLTFIVASAALFGLAAFRRSHGEAYVGDLAAGSFALLLGMLATFAPALTWAMIPLVLVAVLTVLVVLAWKGRV